MRHFSCEFLSPIFVIVAVVTVVVVVLVAIAVASKDVV
jgi:hypothetical protein